MSPHTNSHVALKKASPKVGRPVRTTVQAALAGVIVLWFSRNVFHLDPDQKVIAIALVGGVLSALLMAAERAAGKGLLRELPQVVHPEPTPMVVRIHPDDLARLEARKQTRPRAQ